MAFCSLYGNQTKIACRDESGTDQRIDARHVAELSASSKLSAVGPSTVIDASGFRESRLISIQQRKITAFPVRLFCTGAEKNSSISQYYAEKWSDLI